VRSGPAFLVEAHFYHWSITCATRGRKARSPPLAIVMQKNSIALWSFSNPSVNGLLHRSDTTSCTLDKASNGAGNPTGRGIAERGHHIGLTQVQQLIGKCWLLSRSFVFHSLSHPLPRSQLHISHPVSITPSPTISHSLLLSRKSPDRLRQPCRVSFSAENCGTSALHPHPYRIWLTNLPKAPKLQEEHAWMLH
jgi:hypothetical protein